MPADKNLGYAAAGSATLATMSGLLSEFAPLAYIEAVTNESPFISSGALKEIPQDGKEIVVEVETGVSGNTQFQVDYGARAIGGTAQPAVARYIPATITDSLSLGQNAVKGKMKDDEMSTLIDVKLGIIMKNAARFLSQGIFGLAQNPQAAATWSSTAAGGTVTVPFLSVEWAKPGMTVDFCDLSSSKSYVVRIADVTSAAVGGNSANVAGTVTFENVVLNPATLSVVVLTDTAVAVGDTIRLRGTTAGFGGSSAVVAGNAINSFDAICGSGANAAFAGIDPATTPGWKGTTLALGGVYTQDAMVQFAAQLRRQGGSMFSHAVMSPSLAANHAVSASFGTYGASALAPVAGSRVKQLDASYDKYGNVHDSGLKLLGKPVIIDPNLVSTSILLHNDKNAYLAIWKEMGVDEEDGNGTFINRQNYSTDTFFSGSQQLIVGNRASLGMVTGITGL